MMYGYHTEVKPHMLSARHRQVRGDRLTKLLVWFWGFCLFLIECVVLEEKWQIRIILILWISKYVSLLHNKHFKTDLSSRTVGFRFTFA